MKIGGDLMRLWEQAIMNIDGKAIPSKTFIIKNFIIIKF
jgi:hypothetical protein